MYWLGKRAETQVQQGLPSTFDETYSKERPERAVRNIDRDSIRTAASPRISPVLHELRERPAFQCRHVGLEDLHCLPRYRTR